MKIGITARRAAAGGGGAVPSTVPIYKGSMFDSSNTSASGGTYTFNGKDVGVAHAKRILVVASFVDTSRDGTLVVKANGVNMTSMSFATGGNAVDPDAIRMWRIALPTGDTADISFTTDGPTNEIGAHYWIAYPDDPVPVEIGVDEFNAPASASAVVDNLSTEASGFILAGMLQSNDTNPNLSWSGTGTETVNSNIQNEKTFMCSAGMVTGTGASTTDDLTMTGAFNKAIVAVSWGASP